MGAQTVIAPVWVTKLKGFPQAVRTPGAEIMKAFLERANEMGYSSYFYGDTDATSPPSAKDTTR